MQGKRLRTLRWLCLSTLAAASPAAAGPFDDPGHPIADMVSWATDVDALVRGPVDAAMPGGPEASYGTIADVLGPAAGGPYSVLSLGDGGHITLFFALGIADASGDDFAVFENGFYQGELGLFAELAFVEVSSNGIDFARFESETLQETPIGSYGVLDPTDFDNLAGDQDAGYGTGFDLAELSGHPLALSGQLDLSDVGWVRVIDVIGDGSTFDALGAPVYDPYPTAHPGGGFDLDGVGVLHTVPEPGVAMRWTAGCIGLAILRRLRCPARA